MGSIKNWVVSNEFFLKDGSFSKSAFIMMNTWFFVMLKYIASGFVLSYTKVSSVVLGVVVPAMTVTYTAKFDSTEALTLLTLVFGLYFGNKFAPAGQDSSRTVTSTESVTTSSKPNQVVKKTGE